MESSCYRCGAPVEEGSAFCASCNAPQIKVAVPQPPAKEPLTRPPDIVPPEAVPVGPSQPGAIDWKKYRRLALPLSFVAGIAIAGFYPLGCLLLVVFIIFTVGRYSRNHQGPLKASQGAKMGAFNGFISFVVVAAAALVQLAFDFDESRHQVVLEFQRRIAGNPDPRFQQMAHWLGTNQGFLVAVIFSLIFFLAIFLIVSSFIGAVSVSFSSGKDRR